MMRTNLEIKEQYLSSALIEATATVACPFNAAAEFVLSVNIFCTSGWFATRDVFVAVLADAATAFF